MGKADRRRRRRRKRQSEDPPASDGLAEVSAAELIKGFGSQPREDRSTALDGYDPRRIVTFTTRPN